MSITPNQTYLFGYQCIRRCEGRYAIPDRVMGKQGKKHNNRTFNSWVIFSIADAAGPASIPNSNRLPWSRGPCDGDRIDGPPVVRKNLKKLLGNGTFHFSKLCEDSWRCWWFVCFRQNNMASYTHKLLHLSYFSTCNHFYQQGTGCWEHQNNKKVRPVIHDCKAGGCGERRVTIWSYLNNGSLTKEAKKAH